MIDVVEQVQSTAVLILGMHRSGTSVMTRVVNLLGADLGSHFLPPADDNPKGFWEHLGAYEIHEQLLKALGRSWYDMSEMPDGWMEHPAAIKALSDLEFLIREEFGQSRLWAVKDPRMCRLAPLWIKAAQSLGIRPVAVIVVREPMEVAASLAVRDGWGRGHSYLMWAQHFLESEESTRGLPRTIVSYETLMHDWRGCLTRAAGNLDLKWPAAPDAIADKVAAYIDPTHLRHHSNERMATDPTVPKPPRLINDLYADALGIEQGRLGWDCLPAYQRQYRDAASVFGLPLAEQELLVGRLRSDVHIWQAEAQSMHVRFASLKEEHSRMTQRLGSAEGRLSAERVQLQERVEQLESEIGNLSEASENLRQENEALRASLLELQGKTESRSWLLRRFLGYNKS